jgi:DNA-binding GntR family transcriptional regulator
VSEDFDRFAETDEVWGPTSLDLLMRDGSTLSARAATRLYDDLVSGRLPPGERLKPEDLKERYGIGSSPIREALMRLSALGLVQLEGNRGFRVAPASEAELADIANIRTELSCMALRRSIERGDHAWEGEVVAAFHVMERIKQATIDDPQTHFDEWERRNKQFHNALESACGSPWLLHFCAVAFSQSERYRRAFVGYAAIIPAAQEEHRVMMDAALRRDADTAVAVLRTHIGRGMDLVREAMVQRLGTKTATKKKTDKSRGT